jgi:EAL domain-containing protein (putative c-di-GMP-specific phosphodiesterase class I)
MSCEKCQNALTLPSKKGTLYFMSQVQELTEKIFDLLKPIANHAKNENGIIRVEVSNMHDFFDHHIALVKDAFQEMEREKIKVSALKDGESFDFQTIINAKSLQLFINLFEDKDFFDIVNNESLTSHFQPIVSMDSNEIYGYEMLIRGVCKDGSLMHPQTLFSKSARNDFNFKLDRLCRETALKTAATKRIKQKVFINFIPTAIYDPEYCLKSTEQWAKQLGFDPSQIVFEVVETELVQNQEHLVKILQYYKSKGFMIALDDVGEGYSSLNMLIELQPDIIKIDRNIIDGIDNNSLKKSVYSALWSIASENNIKVLAEGIERQEEYDLVRSIGADYAQGYFFAKPHAEPVRQLSLASMTRK